MLYYWYLSIMSPRYCKDMGVPQLGQHFAVAKSPLPYNVNSIES